jgi:hypothetical protein
MDNNALKAAAQKELMRRAAQREFDRRKAYAGAPTGNGNIALSDVPGMALRNAPTSAMQFAGGIANMVAHPVNTIQGAQRTVGDLADRWLNLPAANAWLAERGLATKRDPAEVQESAERGEAVTQFFKDRYGGWENIKRTVATDPVGAAADASMLLTGGGSALARAPGILGKTGRVVAATGRAVDPVMAAGRVAKGALATASLPVGLLTGTGPQTLMEAYKTGRAGGESARIFRGNMRGKIPQTDVVDEARAAIQNIADARSARYAQNMAGTKVSQKTVDVSPIIAEFNNQVSSLKQGGFVVSPDGIKALDRVAGAIIERLKTPNGRSPAAMDALKKRIDDMMPPVTDANKNVVRVLTAMRNKIKSEIIRQVPEYKKAMADYEASKAAQTEIERSLSLGKKNTKDTALRKLQSVTRNNANTNYGSRVSAAEELALAGARNLMPALAGQSLSSMYPRGLGRLMASGAAIGAGPAALLDPTVAAAAIPAILLSSPRFSGELAHKLGQTARWGRPVGKGLLGAYLLNRGQE